ncbi:MAG TPA: hypothetical protein PLG90_04785 [Ignavibacteria bacterium]|nr:hypothetical protein [Ignavibacteria bacterium]
MKQNCEKLDISNIYGNEFDESFSKLDIYYDLKIENELISLFQNPKFKKRFKYILTAILSNRYTNDIYGKEDISDKCKDITAMKFKNINNLRIYCKEFYTYHKKIVLIQLVYKKSQKVNSKIKNILETIAEYDYDFKKK